MSDFNIDHLVNKLHRESPKRVTAVYYNETYGGDRKADSKISRKGYHKKEVGDPEKIQKILKNYEEISKSYWATIPIDTYVRPLFIDGKLKDGGRVQAVRSNGDGTFTISLAKFKGNTKEWDINTKAVRKIYRFIKREKKESNKKEEKTLDPGPDPLSRLGDKLMFADNDDLITRIETLETEILTIKNNVRKIFIYVKKLDSIIRDRR